MAKQEPGAAERECRHFLWLTLRPGNEGLTLWARCRLCRRSWFLGSHAEVIAGLVQIEEAVS